jgi:hypothetical protein
LKTKEENLIDSFKIVNYFNENQFFSGENPMNFTLFQCKKCAENLLETLTISYR